MIINIKQQEELINKDNLDYQKEKARNKVKNAAQNQINSIRVKTPDYEIQTFDIQQTEWVAWLNDNNSPTPNCDIIALGRNMDRIELLTRIGIKVSAVFNILGIQQGKVDLINGCSTIDQINEIIYSQPPE